jgi:translocator protein
MTITANPISFKQIIITIVAFVVVNFVAGYGVVLLGVDIPAVYDQLAKPYFAPPTWLFGPVWTLNCILAIYGILLTYNLTKSKIRTQLLIIYGFIVLNYSVFQYLSFGSKILFGKLLPTMFFLPTFSMLILTIVAMVYAYRLDTQDTTLRSKILSGKSIFASFWSLISWLIIASALGLGVWLTN